MKWENLLSLKRQGDSLKRLRSEQDNTRVGFDVDYDRIVFSSFFRWSLLHCFSDSYLTLGTVLGLMLLHFSACLRSFSTTFFGHRFLTTCFNRFGDGFSMIWGRFFDCFSNIFQNPDFLQLSHVSAACYHVVSFICSRLFATFSTLELCRSLNPKWKRNGAKVCKSYRAWKTRKRGLFYLPLYSSIELQLQNRLRYSREGVLWSLPKGS